jgi:hypothetical protein
MSVNKFHPHIFVLAEDDANRQIANGFLLNGSLDSRSIQVVPNAGGWTKACDKFEAEYVAGMHNNSNTHVVLLIDFDSQKDRLERVHARIPPDIMGRAFVLGSWSVPEELRRAGLGTFEEIGLKLAEDCLTGVMTTWDHEFLRHDCAELERMSPILRPILFGS